jgi:DNA (cytosine-5)-methyltransferase 1
MTLDEVAPTLTTRCVTPACGRYVHPWENRPITLREAAVLQTFPVDYRFEGGTMAIQAQIGNAVPPRLAEAIAVLVGESLKKTSMDPG